jgi:SAM-dependent MidA family methyltransferase
LLATHFLSACRTESRSLFERLRYVLIDRSPAMRESQRRNLAQWLSRPGLVSWIDDLDDLGPGSITGMFLSNELLDAFPTHRIQVTGGQVEELWVDRQDGQFVECLKPPSTAALAQYAQGLAAHWPDGYRTEINLNALDWIRQVARSLKRGVVFTIDYGHTAQDLYRSDRKNGTFLCYFKQSAHEDPFTHIGEQDMTAHVDFSSLATAGEEHGLQVTGFTNQMSFLMGLGVEQLIASLEPESPEFRAAIHLLKPTGMGGTFKILVQHKGIEQPQLDGLKFKPFFIDALAATRTSV